MRVRKPIRPSGDNRAWAARLAGGAAVLVGAALFNITRARRAEARHPPLGDFVTVDGVRLHYVERGAGAPIVLLHGNGGAGHMVHHTALASVVQAITS